MDSQPNHARENWTASYPVSLKIYVSLQFKTQYKTRTLSILTFFDTTILSFSRMLKNLLVGSLRQMKSESF